MGHLGKNLPEFDWTDFGARSGSDLEFRIYDVLELVLQLWLCSQSSRNQPVHQNFKTYRADVLRHILELGGVCYKCRLCNSLPITEQVPFFELAT